MFVRRFYGVCSAQGTRGYLGFRVLCFDAFRFIFGASFSTYWVHRWHEVLPGSFVTSQSVLLTSRNNDGSRSWISPGLYYVDCVVSRNPFMCYNYICRIQARTAAA